VVHCAAAAVFFAGATRQFRFCCHIPTSNLRIFRGLREDGFPGLEIRVKLLKVLDENIYCFQALLNKYLEQMHIPELAL